MCFYHVLISAHVLVVVVVVVVVRYAAPLPLLNALLASDFANADFAKDDWVMGDGKEKF